MPKFTKQSLKANLDSPVGKKKKGKRKKGKNPFAVMGSAKK